MIDSDNLKRSFAGSLSKLMARFDLKECETPIEELKKLNFRDADHYRIIDGMEEKAEPAEDKEDIQICAECGNSLWCGDSLTETIYCSYCGLLWKKHLSLIEKSRKAPDGKL